MTERTLVYAGVRKSRERRLYAWAPADDLDHPLMFTARLVASPSIGSVYRFQITDEGHVLYQPPHEPAFEGVWPHKKNRAAWQIFDRQSRAELQMNVCRDSGDDIGELTLADVRTRLFEKSGHDRRVALATVLDYLTN